MRNGYRIEPTPAGEPDPSAGRKPHARKRPKDAPTHMRPWPLRPNAAQRRDIRTRFVTGTRVYYAGDRKKKPLSQRVHRCECGIKEHRDLFSAYLGLPRLAPSSGHRRVAEAQPPSATQPARPQTSAHAEVSGAHQRPAQSQRRDATEPVGANFHHQPAYGAAHMSNETAGTRGGIPGTHGREDVK